jgi:hypothetical protein
MRASRRTDIGEIVPGAILRDGRASKSTVADFDTLTLPKSGKPDFGERGLLRMRSEGFDFDRSMRLVSCNRSTTDFIESIYESRNHDALIGHRSGHSESCDLYHCTGPH